MVQMNSKNKKEEIEVDDKMEADVSDEEMARRYTIPSQYWLYLKICDMLSIMCRRRNKKKQQQKAFNTSVISQEFWCLFSEITLGFKIS